MRQEFIELLESNLDHAENFKEKFDHVQDGQDPDFVTVCCSDSRVLQDHMWGNEHPGEVFTCSNIGNRVFQDMETGEAVSGDVLYPVAHTDTKTMVVVGHTSCGAVTATYKDLTEDINEPSGIRHCIDLIKDRLKDGVEKLPDDLDDSEAINRLVEYNVDQQVQFLRNSDEIPEDVDVIGAVYDFQNVYSGDRGQIHLINVNGENSVEKLKEENPEVSERFERLWEP
ncbi:carbonic anhydrase [Candidatus Nanohalobium constans]|uniref:carbonic anhydrase n=1 Tax=Candidatus Nanohalobium constans TaxID=2565781 RepID=A0A5Q0UHZ4_9ARCH|nr:carbonic anhydrase [Candidatus Nanohalobium constans]QGA80509.1 carbonic anhydrase [Candidatus Nanohalobium constans]